MKVLVAFKALVLLHEVAAVEYLNSLSCAVAVNKIFFDFCHTVVSPTLVSRGGTVSEVFHCPVGTRTLPYTAELTEFHCIGGTMWAVVQCGSQGPR